MASVNIQIYADTKLDFFFTAFVKLNRATCMLAPKIGSNPDAIFHTLYV